MGFCPWLLCGLWGGRAQAQNITDIDLTQGYSLKPVPLSFGGAFRALADTNAAILLNPAGLAQRKGKVSVSGDYLYNDFAPSNTFGVAVSDYKATPVMAFGLAYDYDQRSIGGNDINVHQVTLAGAGDFSEILYVGMAAKYYVSTVDSPFITGPDGPDIDVGFLVKPIPLLSLALTAQNLAQGYSHNEFPLSMGFGGALNLQPYARIAIDVTKNFETSTTNGVNAYFGGEIRAAEGLFLRSGFGLDRVRDNNFWGVGAVSSTNQIGVGFTYARHLSPTSNTFAGNLELYF